jgi:hypothetical protein
VPNNLQQNTCVTTVPSSSLPSTENAISMYIQNGGRLTVPPVFGYDPLRYSPYLIHLRERKFFSKFIDFHNLLPNVVSGDGTMFMAAILEFIQITISLSNLT